MNQKGQFFSLDFVIMLLLAFFAIGLLLNFFEIQTVNAKENQLRKELQNIGEGAAHLLVSSKDITCSLTSIDPLITDPLDFLPNCLGNAPDRVTKTNLGIPEGYGCLVTIDETLFDSAYITGCSTPVPLDAENVFSATRKIVVKNDNDPETTDDFKVTKTELEYCIDDDPDTDCPLVDTDISLSVWRGTQ